MAGERGDVAAMRNGAWRNRPDASEGVARGERVVLTVQRQKGMVSEVEKEMGWFCAEELVGNRGCGVPAWLRRGVAMAGPK